MSDKNSNLSTRLRDMAQLAVISNRISEIQEKNLKMYPFVFFNSVQSVRIGYDLSKIDDDGLMKHGDHHVSFYLEVEDPEGKNESMEYRFKSIEGATRVLFWNDLVVKVFFNEKLVYESNQNV